MSACVGQRRYASTEGTARGDKELQLHGPASFPRGFFPELLAEVPRAQGGPQSQDVRLQGAGHLALSPWVTVHLFMYNNLQALIYIQRQLI